MPKSTPIVSKRRPPLACFDTMQRIDDCEAPNYLSVAQARDFQIARSFLQAYIGSQGTFNSYRRDVERLLHWAWHIEDKTLKQLKREHIESFLLFCQKPPASWIGVKKAPRFVNSQGLRIPNSEWRPFVVTISKSAHRKGKPLEKAQYSASNGAIKELMAIISSFYQYLLIEDYVLSNPVAMIRQKSRFVQKRQDHTKVRRLSPEQWQAVIDTATRMADDNPQKHERTLFMISMLYGMYLRISELAASQRWTPTMSDFHKDHDGLWWFTTVGKGNKERQIAVSDSMLAALKRWRKYRGLSVLPSPGDNAPLLPLYRGSGPLSNTTHIRNIVQECFNQAIAHLANVQQRPEEAEAMMDATVHWLRHTGISDDVKIRPREHVRDDAGHSSGAITDRYIDVGLKERHKSAKRKPLQTK